MKKQIKQVVIDPGCISCGSCEVICPEVFEVTSISHVKTNVDFTKNQECIREAMDMCPVSVIKIIEQDIQK